MEDFFNIRSRSYFLTKTNTKSIHLAVTYLNSSNIKIKFIISAHDHQNSVKLDLEDFVDVLSKRDHIRKIIKKKKKETTVIDRRGFKISVKNMHEKRGVAISKGEEEVRILGGTFAKLMMTRDKLQTDYNKITQQIKDKVNELLTFAKKDLEGNLDQKKRIKIEKIVKKLTLANASLSSVKF